MSMSDDAITRVKGATKDLVRSCGGLERSARICGFSDSTISRWQLPKYGDVIPIMAALTLEAECEIPWVTSAMAEINGCRLAEPGGDRSGGANLRRLYAEADLALSEAGLALQEAEEDGVVTPTEAELLDHHAAKHELKWREFRQGVAKYKVRVVKGDRQ